MNKIKCVSCGREIEDLNSENLQNYDYYIEGGGALCFDCWKRIYGNKGE